MLLILKVTKISKSVYGLLVIVIIIFHIRLWKAGVSIILIYFEQLFCLAHTTLPLCLTYDYAYVKYSTNKQFNYSRAL